MVGNQKHKYEVTPTGTVYMQSCELVKNTSSAVY
jgi:hypothetical protein